MSLPRPRNSDGFAGGDMHMDALQLMAEKAELSRDKAEAESNLQEAEAKLQVTA